MATVMKKTYTIKSKGLECFPEFNTLKEAQKELKEWIKEDLLVCRARFGSGTKHKMRENHYRVTIGKDKDSALWSESFIE